MVLGCLGGFWGFRVLGLWVFGVLGFCGFVVVFFFLVGGGGGGKVFWAWVSGLPVPCSEFPYCFLTNGLQGPGIK